MCCKVDRKLVIKKNVNFRSEAVHLYIFLSDWKKNISIINLYYNLLICYASNERWESLIILKTTIETLHLSKNHYTLISKSLFEKLEINLQNKTLNSNLLTKHNNTKNLQIILSFFLLCNYLQRCITLFPIELS